MAYSNKVIDHYNNPRNVGTLDKSSNDVGTGLVGAPECGDVMRLQIKVNPETQVIEEAKFKTFGCGSAIASSSLATEWIKGKKVEDALAIKNTDIVKELALPPVKIHSAMAKENVSPEQGGLRLGVSGGGCSGLSYQIRFDSKPRERDRVYEFEGVRVFVDPKSFIYLAGMVLDWEESLMKQGFNFINPNSSKSCGCGSSFSA